ncbi:hypothetical protein [Porphyromonas endodontalis]
MANVILCEINIDSGELKKGELIRFFFPLGCCPGEGLPVPCGAAFRGFFALCVNAKKMLPSFSKYLALQQNIS